jgi:hypothetical protein
MDLPLKRGNVLKNSDLEGAWGTVCAAGFNSAFNALGAEAAATGAGAGTAAGAGPAGFSPP